MRLISRPDEPKSPVSAAARARHGTAAALLVVALAAALPILFSLTGGKADAAINRCHTPDEILSLDQPLPHVAQRLAVGRSLTIVALGSSSTAGAGASRPEFSYPSRLAVLLATRLPGFAVRVVNRGVGGEEAAAMVKRIDRQVLPEKPDLVIWQVGSNSVLRNTDPAAVMTAVHQGILRIKAAGSDVLLMNAQYAPALLQHSDYHETLHRLAAIARAEGVPLFRRAAMMRHWTEDGQMTLATMLAPDHLHMNDLSYDCLAQEVSASILRAAGAPATPLVATRPEPKA